MFVEDVSVFFAGWPAVDATLDGQPLRVIIEREYMQVFGGMGSSGPAATAPSAAVSAATTASLLVASGADAVALGVAGTYRVKSIQSDGTGISLLPLELQ